MDAGTREPLNPDFTGNSPWRWEWWKVGLAPEDLFTTLAAKYNTVPYRIQGDEAFHHDVSDAAHEAKNIDDFYTRLACRRHERLQELRKAWDSIAIDIICSPTIFGDDLDRLTHWCAFQQFTSSRSLDSIVLFFNSFLPPTTLAAPQLRDTQLSGSPPSEADRTESSLPDTAVGSPQANPPDPTTRARQQPTPPPPPPPPLPLLPPPRRTTRRSSPLDRPHAGAEKRRQQQGRPSRQRASDAQAGIGAQNPSFSRHKRPFRQGKASRKGTRTSLRLAGLPPDDILSAFTL